MILLLLACAGAPAVSPDFVRSTTFLGLAEDGGVVSLRATVGNTGLWKGAGHLRLLRSFAEGPPFVLARHEPPPRVEQGPKLLRIGGDGFSPTEGGGARFIHRGPASAIDLTLWPSPRPPLTDTVLSDAGERHVEVDPLCGAFDGWLEAEGVGGRLGGRGLLLHEGGDAPPQGARYTFFAGDASTCLFAIGDPNSSAGIVYDGEASAPVHIQAGDGPIPVGLRVEGLADLTWSLRVATPLATVSYFDHLSGPEQALLRSTGRPVRESLWAIRVTGTLGSRPTHLPGLLRVVEP